MVEGSGRGLSKERLRKDVGLLTLQPGPIFDVDAINLEPPNNPTNIDDVIPQSS